MRWSNCFCWETEKVGVSHLGSDPCHLYYSGWGIGKFDAHGSYLYPETLDAAEMFEVCPQKANDQKLKYWKWRENDLEVLGVAVGMVLGLWCFL